MLKTILYMNNFWFVILTRGRIFFFNGWTDLIIERKKNMIVLRKLSEKRIWERTDFRVQQNKYSSSSVVYLR